MPEAWREEEGTKGRFGLASPPSFHSSRPAASDSAESGRRCEDPLQTEEEEVEALVQVEKGSGGGG